MTNVGRQPSNVDRRVPTAVADHRGPTSIVDDRPLDRRPALSSTRRDIPNRRTLNRVPCATNIVCGPPNQSVRQIIWPSRSAVSLIGRFGSSCHHTVHSANRSIVRTAQPFSWTHLVDGTNLTVNVRIRLVWNIARRYTVIAQTRQPIRSLRVLTALALVLHLFGYHAHQFPMSRIPVRCRV